MLLELGMLCIATIDVTFTQRRYRREIDPPIQRLLHLYNDRIKSDRLGFDQFEPVAAFATLGFALVEPHPTDGRCVLLAHAADDTEVGDRRHQIRAGRCAGHPFVHFHLVRVLEQCFQFSNSSPHLL